MKKYLAAGAVAVAAFAFTASAASLNVLGGVLQAGDDSDLTCTDEARVVSYRIDDVGSGTDETVVSLGVRIDQLDGCVDQNVGILAYAWDGEGNKVARSAITDVTSDVATLTWDRGGVDPELIETIQVVLETDL